ncbi:MAG TPA: AAA family ATPase [Polyangiales bacterium]|nr:AAA family ATPase [Polyangiales bacterium]
MTRANGSNEASELHSLPAGPLDVRLLGSFELRDAAGRVLRLNTRKAEALLALLALQSGQPQARDKLCALLWPEVREAQARHSLRQTLLQLRKALASTPSALWSDSRGLQLTAAGVRSDFSQLQRCIAQNTRDALHEASQWYRGDLLDGLTVGEAPFDHWLRGERKRVREQMAEALSRLLAIESEAQRDAEALQVCSRLLALDPLREEAHRSMMSLLVRQGRRAAALEHYIAFAATLRSQLGSEPDPLTQQLFAQLERTPNALTSEPAPAAAVSIQNKPTTLATSGRAQELERLFAALQTAAKAQAQVALLVGEAGVGKTHLCDCVVQAAEARGFRVLRARCFESEQVLPLSLWANLLRDAITPDTQLSREQRAELSTLIPELSPDEPPRTSDARKLFHAVHELVTRLADASPLLLLLEDMHWADEMSARLLSYLGRHQRQTRCLLLVSVREEDVPAGSFIAAALGELAREQQLSRVELAPLSNADTRELSDRLAQHHELPPLEAAVYEQIWAISQGNPLVIVESVRALACGVLARDVTQLPVPERVRTLIQNRVAKVSVAAREVLAVAAVAGRELELDVLMSALEGLPLTAALDELARAQLVRAIEERVYFTHDRIRETLYSEMLPVSRRLLHGRVAKALEQRESKLPATLGHIGYHYSKAGNAPSAVRYLMRFADLAFRDHGINEALVALEQAFADAESLPKAERDRLTVEIVIRQAYCFISLTRMAELIARMQKLAPQLEPLERPDLAGAFHFFWGFALALTADPRVAKTHAQRALAYATRCNDERITAFTHVLLSYLCFSTSSYQEGVAHGLMATERLAKRADSVEATSMAWLCLALNQIWLGYVPDALKAATKASDIALATDNLRVQALSASVLGVVYAATDQWELALAETQRGLKASREPFTFFFALWSSAWAQSGSGQTAPAIELLTQVIEQLDQHGMRAWCGHATVILADAHIRSGNPARAVELAGDAIEIANVTDDRGCYGWALRARGQALCMLGQYAAARTQLDDAMQLFEPLEARLDQAKCLVEHAVLELAEQRKEAAQHDLQRAHALFTACHATESLLRVTRLMAAAAPQPASQEL